MNNNKCGMWGVILLISLIFLPTVGAGEGENRTEDMKNVISITWSPGEELSAFNQQFTGRTSSPPEGATIKEGRKLIIWMKCNGISEEMHYNGNITRSDKATLLLQYGNNKRRRTAPTIKIENNVATVKYKVTNRWRVHIGNKTYKHSETLRISERYILPPIDSSCFYVLNEVEIIKTGLSQRILMNSTAFAYNFELRLKPTKNSSMYNDEFFINAKRYYYEIRKDERHYYGIARPLEMTEISAAQKVFLCDAEKSLCFPEATLDELIYYDAFGYSKSVNNYSVIETKSRVMGWNALIPIVIIGYFIFCLVKKIPRIRG